MQGPTPSLAMALCVRDEQEFLAAHLLYHQAIGVQRAYVFLDRCTDRSAEIARAFPWVEAIVRDRDPGVRYMSVHQVNCLNEALARARAEGFDWLLHLDADEFANGDSRPEFVRRVDRLRRRQGSRQVLASAHLPSMLAGVAPTTEMVILGPREAIPTPLADGEAFWKLHFFQARGVWSRRLLDPTTGQLRYLRAALGHDKGKSIVRTSADVQAASAHRWTRRQRRTEAARTAIPTEYRGFHYHFVVVRAQQWLSKYRKFAEYPDRWQTGAPVRFPKQAWKEASATMSPEEARTYYNRWVVARPREFILPLLLGRVVHDTSVEEVLLQETDVHRLEWSAPNPASC